MVVSIERAGEKFKNKEGLFIAESKKNRIIHLYLLKISEKKIPSYITRNVSFLNYEQVNYSSNKTH